jgi:hypothetical protein
MFTPRRRFSLLLFIILMILAPVLAAQEQTDQATPAGAPAATPPAPAAPIPAQITAAKKVFIANLGGGAAGPRNYAYYSGPGERLYNQFYAALKSWGHYQLISSPAEADLILQVRLVSELGENVAVSQFRLAFLDPRTGTALWGLREYIEPATLQHNRDKNFDLALNRLVDDVKRLSGAPDVSADGMK